MVFGLPYEVLGIASRGASSEQCGGSFTWQSYPPSMRLAQLYRYGVTRKAALAAFLAFAVKIPVVILPSLSLDRVVASTATRSGFTSSPGPVSSS
jgi:hypothetical protein